MAAFPGYTHRTLGGCTPRQIVALHQQARRARHRQIAMHGRAVYLAGVKLAQQKFDQLERD